MLSEFPTIASFNFESLFTSTAQILFQSMLQLGQTDTCLFFADQTVAVDYLLDSGSPGAASRVYFFLVDISIRSPQILISYILVV